MTNTCTELDRLQHQIGQADAETRHRMEPQLRRMIERLRAEGLAVPDQTKSLHEVLLCEAIEAQFENMPV
ncbi:putative N-acetylmannosamine-6-phosphate epimerase [Roseovarius sp. MBR-51]